MYFGVFISEEYSTMKKVVLIILVLSVILGTIGCGSENKASNDATPPAATVSEEKATSEAAAAEAGKQSDAAPEAGEQSDVVAEESADVITYEQARDAIRNYCHSNNPDLEDLEKSGEYPIYWGVVSNDENEIVILYRSYTGALTYFYIDPVTGETYTTESVPGITLGEERTDESFNVKDYIY